MRGDSRRFDMHAVNKNLAAGVLFTVLGALGLWFGRSLRSGSLNAIDSGFLPTVALGGLLIVGVIKICLGLASRGDTVSLAVPRGFLFVALGLVLFGLLVDKQGLLVALTAMLVSVEFAGNHEKSWRQFAALLVCLLAGSVLVFKYLLGVSVDVLPSWI